MRCGTCNKYHPARHACVYYGDVGNWELIFGCERYRPMPGTINKRTGLFWFVLGMLVLGLIVFLQMAVTGAAGRM